MTYQPSEAELEILQILWDIEPATVRSIHERIAAAGKEVGYTTVLKQIQRLTEKGVLEKEVVNGSHLFRTLIKETDVKRELAGKVMRTAFGGSALQMVMHALGQDKAKLEELQELKKWLDNQLSGK
jgi:predicted transcriptional regulator